MKVSERGLALIRKFEGFRSHLYNDAAGHCTIGYGHLVHYGPIDGRASELAFKDGITEKQGDMMLRADANDADLMVFLKVRVPITQSQYDALVSFCYNLGELNFTKSTLLKKLNAGDYQGAQFEFAKWNHAAGEVLPGLTERRKEEASLFAENACDTRDNDTVIR